MKKLTILFLFISFALQANKVQLGMLYVAPSSPTPEYYGAVGNGTTDDLTALQSWIDSGSLLNATSGKTYRVSDSIEFNQPFSHVILGNGAIFTTTTGLTSLEPIFNIDKRASNGGTTEIRNVLVDGNNLATRIVTIKSRVTFFNVDVQNAYHFEGASPTGIDIEFFDDDDVWGIWNFDGCDLTNISGKNDGEVGNSIGAANALSVKHKEIMSQTTILNYKNASLTNCWGEDSQNIALFSAGLDITNTPIMQNFENLVCDGWERRAVKAFCGQQYWLNCKFYDPDPNNPILAYEGIIAGLVVVSAGSGATGAGNITFEGCELISRGYDGRFILFDTTGDVTVNNTTFSSGTKIELIQEINNFDFCGNTIASGVTIFDNSWNRITSDGANSNIRIGNNNVYGDDYATFTSQLGFYTYSQATLSCPPVSQLANLDNNTINTVMPLLIQE